MTSKTNPSGEAALSAAAAPRRRVRVWMWAVPLLAVAGFFGWQWLQSTHSVSTDNAYIKAGRILIAPQVAGRVVEVAVGQNEPVKAGQLLFRIDTRPLELAVARAEAQLASIDNSANASRAGVKSTSTSIAAARETLTWAQRDLARMQELASRQLVAHKMLDDARHAVAEARSTLANAQALQQQASASLSGNAATPTDELPEYRAAVAQLETAKLDLAHAEVRAPVDGIVGTHDLQAGEYLNLGQTAMPLVAGAPIWVEANFKETELTRLQVGQPATVRVDAYPKHQWTARVASISPASGGEFSVLPPQNATGNWVKIVQRVPVRLEIAGADVADGPALRSGMSAEVDVELKDMTAAAAAAN
ncbi:HlyD family secretion protein [Stenotrophomonas sp. YIM B06876]|uniref:HlyD family secretion protein n=1 Tax=Stenotrophomonas sp. YIM B06876 TaxID=3060211 RepID=UPI002739DFF3|nr:HlyD family secretion protein [Stenotrophomonas sp. YIM B06876]